MSIEQKSSSDTRKPTDDELYQFAQDILNRAKTGLITGDEVRFHPESYMVFPEDLTYGKAAEILARKEEEANKITRFRHSFNYRLDDGLHATAQVMKRMFGMTLGKTIRTFFGDIPPEMKTIKTGVNTTLQVPHGNLEIPSLENTRIHLGPAAHKEYGQIYSIIFEGPNKYRKIIDRMFAEIEKELQVNSIYRGKVVSGADELDFIDLSGFDPKKIVFSDSVVEVLENGLFAPIRHTSQFELDSIPLKRSVLLYGPYGTGKSSIGQITGQVAEQNGWTFLMARTGRDKVEDVLKTARLYEPAVVFVEDIDTQAAGSDPMDVARLLDAFDGITAKDSKLIMVMTTNHVDKIHKGMLRPGRLDFTVEVSALDRNGVERLIKAVVGESKLDPAVDYDAVWEEMQGFEPAFVRATADRAKTWGINRTKSQNYVLTTDDLTGAARSLHPQLALLKAANEGTPKTTIEDIIEETTQKAMFGLTALDMDGDPSYHTNSFKLRDKDRTNKDN